MQEIIFENVFVLFLLCNPTDNFDRNGNGILVLMRLLLDFRVFRKEIYRKSGNACIFYVYGLLYNLFSL
jgi:hypothetical protein